MSELIKPSDLQHQAQELQSAGKMPSIQDVLKAVAESREKYADKIKTARNQPEHPGVAALENE